MPGSQIDGNANDLTSMVMHLALPMELLRPG